MAEIQDGSLYVQAEDWPKFSAVWFSLQVSILNGRAMVAILIISGNGRYKK